MMRKIYEGSGGSQNELEGIFGKTPTHRRSSNNDARSWRKEEDDTWTHGY